MEYFKKMTVCYCVIGCALVTCKKRGIQSQAISKEKIIKPASFIASFETNFSASY